VAVIGIGVDSGGTHSTCAVARGEGPPQLSAGDEQSSSISDARGRRSLKATLDWIYRRVLHHTDEEDEVCVWIGAAAGFPGAAFRIIEEEPEEFAQRIQAQRPDCEVFIANDAVSILKAPLILGKGLAAIVGTGSIVLGTHPSYPNGVLRRGGYEWPVGDIGAGVWLTVEAIRGVLEDIQTNGSAHYNSALLDRLCDYFDVSDQELTDLPESHYALGRAEMLAANLLQSREELKRHIAGFVHPHLFDLAQIAPGRPHDPIAATVIAESVEAISGQIAQVSETLAAFTADQPNERERLSLVVGGNIAANPIYANQLSAAISRCRYARPMEIIGNPVSQFAELSLHYLRSAPRERRLISRSLDPCHQVMKLV